MDTETPQQRRTRLIELYAGRHVIPNRLGEVNPCAEQVVMWATRLADAVIAAAPQEPDTYDEKAAKEFMTEQGNIDMGYPTTIETRLIDLCELAYTSGSMWYEWDKEFESIKNDIKGRKL